MSPGARARQATPPPQHPSSCPFATVPPPVKQAELPLTSHTDTLEEAEEWNGEGL